MREEYFEIKSNEKIAENTYKLVLSGNTEDCAPGKFVNIKISGEFLRRPISVCDCESGTLTLIYRAVGIGTEKLCLMKTGRLNLLTYLGNGYDTGKSGEAPLLIGGGVGVPPLFLLCRRLIGEGKRVFVILGFNSSSEVFYENEFRALGANVTVATSDGSYGMKGFATDFVGKCDGYTYFYACGPEPMLRAACRATSCSGQLSFEERMGCGFGACMGCSCRTLTGNKRICRDGPVLEKEEIIWRN